MTRVSGKCRVVGTVQNFFPAPPPLPTPPPHVTRAGGFAQSNTVLIMYADNPNRVWVILMRITPTRSGSYSCRPVHTVLITSLHTLLITSLHTLLSDQESMQIMQRVCRSCRSAGTCWQVVNHPSPSSTAKVRQAPESLHDKPAYRDTL